MLKIRNLKAGFGKKEILHGLDLDINKNEIVAIIGHSGCGKSTFLKSINHIIIEENGYIEGKIIFNNIDTFSMNKELLRQKIGMVFQNPIAFPMSIEKNLSYVLKYHGKFEKDTKNELIKETLKKVKLYEEVKDILKDRADRLSGGQKQRLAIARSLCVNPEILLLDEPCSALDMKNTIEIEEMLIDLKSNYTIIIVTHNLNQAKRIADRVVFMDKGNIIEVTEKEKFFKNPCTKKAQELIKYL